MNFSETCLESHTKRFCARTEKFCAARVPLSTQAKQVHLPTTDKIILRFDTLNMPEKQSHNIAQFWKHFDIASNIQAYRI